MDCGYRGSVHTTHDGTQIFNCNQASIGYCTLVETDLNNRITKQPFQVCGTSCPHFEAKAGPKVDVVVTSHNYGHFLGECIDSVAAQGSAVGNLIVVDDASDRDDQTKAVCEARGVQYLRVDVRSPHLARGAGFALCTSPLVHFLDADNTLQAGYLKSASSQFAADPSLAIAYPSLQFFGDETKLVEQPAIFDAARFERINFIDTGSVWLSEAIRQVDGFANEVNGWEDWRLARSILRSGRWSAARCSIPLNYRKHTSQRMKTLANRSYFDTAGLADECVTIFTTFSKRIQESPDLWERRKEWLRNQTWPNVRLVVVNTSHEPLPDGWDAGLPQVRGVSYYEHFVGSPGLEDKSRMGNQPVENQVNTAVAAIYNRMWQEARDEFVLVLEDDVFPHRLDAIDVMMRSFAANTCAVTGKYRQRYFPYGITAWRTTPANGRPSLPNQGPDEGIEDIEGAGFGCILLRRSQLEPTVITANTATSPYYDVTLFSAASKAGKKVRINWGVDCDHAGQQMPAPHAVDKLTILIPTTHRQTLERALRSVTKQTAIVDEIILVSDGPIAPATRKLWISANHRGRLVELDGPHGDWGHTPRNLTLPSIESGYVVHLDDDDAIADGALEHVRKAIKKNHGDLFLFQMRRSDGSLIPTDNEVRQGNVGTPMFVHPAGIPLGKFGTVYGSDYDFIRGTIAANPDRKLHWVPSVICDIRPVDKKPVATKSNFAPCANLGDVIRTDKCEICGSAAGPKGVQVTVRACDRFGECSSARYRQLAQPHVCNRGCAGFTELVQIRGLETVG